MLVDQIDREVIEAQTATVTSHIITRILLRLILALTLLVRPKIVNAPSTLTKPPTIAIAKNDDSDCELDAKLGGPKEPHAFISCHSHSTQERSVADHISPIHVSSGTQQGQPQRKVSWVHPCLLRLVPCVCVC